MMPGLTRPEAFAFDPDFALVAGVQYPAPERANFGIFLDSSPDRWGRVLMQRRENARARRDGQKPRSLTEWDFLLGVHDETRLIGTQGISLSPAYDINPSIERDDLSLAINEVETTCDVAIALEASKDYGLSRREADAILGQVKTAVESWRHEATQLRIPRAEQALMS